MEGNGGTSFFRSCAGQLCPLQNVSTVALLSPRRTGFSPIAEIGHETVDRRNVCRRNTHHEGKHPRNATRDGKVGLSRCSKANYEVSKGCGFLREKTKHSGRSDLQR